MGAEFEAVDISVRQAPAQIPQIAFEEDRVLRPPDERRRTVEGGDVGTDALELIVGGVPFVDGDVGDEAADPMPLGRGLVRGAEAGADLGERSPRRGVTRRNPSVSTVAVGGIGPAKVARRGAGIGASSGWWTAVLRLIAASTRSRFRAAQPSERTPPQSWPRVTTGWPVPASARRGVTTASKSAMRWEIRRTSAP